MCKNLLVSGKQGVNEQWIKNVPDCKKGTHKAWNQNFGKSKTY